MLPTLDHKIDGSVFLWLDNLLVENMRGFSSYSGAWYPSASPINGQTSFAAPHRQFVYDSSIAGVTVPNSATVNGSSTPVGANLAIDFLHGQAIFSGAAPTSVAGSYSAKEVNLYLTSKSDESLLLENKYQTTAKHDSFTGFNPLDHTVPCIFVKPSAGSNKTISLDSMAATTIPVRLVLIFDNQFSYRAVTSALRDKQERNIPILNPNQMPFNYLGQLTGTFDYSAVATAAHQDPYNMAFIRKVSISDMPDKVNNEVGPNMKCGFVDLDLEILRFPN